MSDDYRERRTSRGLTRLFECLPLDGEVLRGELELPAVRRSDSRLAVHTNAAKFPVSTREQGRAEARVRETERTPAQAGPSA